MHPRFTQALIFVVAVELCNFSYNLISLNLKTLWRRIYKFNPPPPPKKGGTITIQTIRLRKVVILKVETIRSLTLNGI
jgi:hypothetical protein